MQERKEVEEVEKEKKSFFEERIEDGRGGKKKEGRRKVAWEIDSLEKEEAKRGKIGKNKRV